MKPAAFTHGRSFELFYSLGGHGGPYWTLASAIRQSVRLLLGSATETRIVIRDRAKYGHQVGENVAIVERTGFSVDVVVLDDREQLARQSFDINHSRRLRGKGVRRGNVSASYLAD